MRMYMYLKKSIRAKFHPDPIWDDVAWGFFWRRLLQQQQEAQQQQQVDGDCGSVFRELIYCMGRMNFEHLFYTRKLCFLYSLVSCKNDVVSSVVEVFVRTEEYMKTCDFANVKPRDNKAKIFYTI